MDIATMIKRRLDRLKQPERRREINRLHKLCLRYHINGFVIHFCFIDNSVLEVPARKP